MLLIAIYLNGHQGKSTTVNFADVLERFLQSGKARFGGVVAR